MLATYTTVYVQTITVVLKREVTQSSICIGAPAPITTFLSIQLIHTLFTSSCLHC